MTVSTELLDHAHEVEDQLQELSEVLGLRGRANPTAILKALEKQAKRIEELEAQLDKWRGGQ